MPFTLAHPAAVLPLRRLGLPVTAMVAGSTVPDLPVFARPVGGYAVTHSWLGVVTLDPLLALLACALWYAVVRDALVDLAPAPLRARLAPHVRLSARAWLLLPVAAVAGAATHVVWDAFTHVGRWGVTILPALDAVHGGRHGYQWAQYVSGVVGLLVLAVAAATWLTRQPVRPRPRRVPGRIGRLTAGSAGLVALGAAVTALVAATGARGDRHDMVVAAVVDGLIALAAGLVLVGLLWWVVAGRTPA